MSRCCITCEKLRFNPLQPSGHYMYRQFNIQQLYVLPTQCIYVFCVDLRTNSDYFPTQHQLTGFITQTQCVYCAVRTGYLYTNAISLRISTVSAVHNTVSTQLSVHNTVSTQHCQYTTLSVHNAVSTQRCQYTTLSVHNTVSTQHCQYTTQHCLYTTLSVHNTVSTQLSAHNTVSTQHNTVSTQHCQYTTLSAHNTVSTQHCLTLSSYQHILNKVFIYFSKNFLALINFTFQSRAPANFLQLVSMFSAFSPSILALYQSWWAFCVIKM
jgi:hypothetical protein